MVVCAFNPNTWETEGDGCLPAWSIVSLSLVQESHNNTRENIYVFIQIPNFNFFMFKRTNNSRQRASECIYSTWTYTEIKTKGLTIYIFSSIELPYRHIGQYDATILSHILYYFVLVKYCGVFQ